MPSVQTFLDLANIPFAALNRILMILQLFFQVGISVGYHIRLENRTPRPRGSITFCTIAMLLQWMRSDPDLTLTSHVVLDEVHERGIFSDFALIVLKRLAITRPDIKVKLLLC